jgi:hypothetical protein
MSTAYSLVEFVEENHSPSIQDKKASQCASINNKDTNQIQLSGCLILHHHKLILPN